ncbi:hypothetical protein KAR91_16490 [Candidatus Pacearchaeota archaeon]|nr:hypothetical protein [Candidatus Pacearchaeota archaeon]
MSKEKGSNMDNETRTALDAIESKLESLIRTLISAGFREVKDIISELFNKDIDHANEHLSRHDKYHEEHYKEAKKMWKAIDDLRSSMPTEIDRKLKPLIADIEYIKARQIEASVSHDIEDKIEDKMDRKKELSYGKVGVLMTVATAIGAGVVFLINYF